MYDDTGEATFKPLSAEEHAAVMAAWEAWDAALADMDSAAAASTPHGPRASTTPSPVRVFA
jgi:hypothetical protein